MSNPKESQPIAKPTEKVVQVGEIVRCTLTPEQLAEIDERIAKVTAPELEELKRIKRSAGNINPLTFLRKIG